MQISKSEIVDLLRGRGEHDKATSVDSTLPEHVDTEQDAGLLAQLGVQVQELPSAAGEATG